MGTVGRTICVTRAPDSPSLDKDKLIASLVARLAALEAEIATLKAENATLRKENGELRARLDLPPKTPDNSSTPPAQGQKASGEAAAKPKAQPHAGAHRPLHPNPTHRRDMMASHCPHCRADVSGITQEPVHAYDRLEDLAVVDQHQIYRMAAHRVRQSIEPVLEFRTLECTLRTLNGTHDQTPVPK